MNSGSGGGGGASSSCRRMSMGMRTAWSTMQLRRRRIGRGKTRVACSLCDEDGTEEKENENETEAGALAESSSSSSSSWWSKPAVGAAIGVVRFYKAAISPVLPKSCRFIPTCSTYSIEAFERFGFSRGMLLTTWRLLRCVPWGGSGYDPPRWPPVGYWHVGSVEETNRIASSLSTDSL